MRVKQPEPPSGLGTEGRRLWREIVADTADQGLEFDARELSWLRHACKIADRVNQLEAELNGAEMVVKGHDGQPVANPLLTEVRQHQALLAQTPGRLRLDVPEQPGTGKPAIGNRHRAAALTRWYGSA
jgi:hypothetical protein